jgi:hypothetical protein
LVIVLEMSETTTGRMISRAVKNGNANAIISRDAKKDSDDHSAFTGRATVN